MTPTDLKDMHDAEMQGEAPSQAPRLDPIRALLVTAHGLTELTDDIAAQIAALLGIEPDSEAITDAIWNCPDTDKALAMLTEAAGQ